MTIIKTGIPCILLVISSFFLSCNASEEDNKTQPGSNNLHFHVSVQDSLALSLDKSPMDISYFPSDYPKEKMITPTMANPVARVIYSRPQRNDRIIFGDSSVTENVIQHYDREWRLGANEATEIEFFKEVSINGKKIAPGRYILYCIPYPNRWKMIINQNLYSWGLHIDKTKDIAETDIPVTKTSTNTEYFTMIFQQAAGGCNLVMSWGDMRAVLPISFQ